MTCGQLDYQPLVGVVPAEVGLYLLHDALHHRVLASAPDVMEGEGHHSQCAVAEGCGGGGWVGEERMGER